MVLSSAIVCDRDRRIADDRRSSFHMIADDRRPYCDLRSAIRDHMETSLKSLTSSPENHQLLNGLQEAIENKEETEPDLEQKMAEQDCEQRDTPQDTQHQTVELIEQIKMLQEQLQEVGISELLQLFLSVT